jgi:hypothetical protein
MGARVVARNRVGHAALAVAAVLLGLILYGAPAAGAATFAFSTGPPDGRMALASRPDSSGKPEIEAADDFVLSAPTAITHATFTGLLPGPGSVQAVTVEIYRVFPLDSSTTRSPQVPTRTNSPSDVDFQERDSTHGQLSYSQQVISNSFTAANSVLNGIHALPNQTTGGEGPVTGQEVTFSVLLNNPFVLPAGHYFFVPQVQVSGPPSANFYWLSTPHPVISPGTPFAAGVPDLQAWIRNSALEPDWLRVGTDIVGGATPPLFNAAFTLTNAPLPFMSSTQPLPGRVGVRLAVGAPSAGTVRASDPEVGKRGKNGHKAAWFNTVTVRRKHAGVVDLTIVPNATGRKHLSKRPLHLVVEVTFTPPGGQPSKRAISISWSLK